MCRFPQSLPADGAKASIVLDFAQDVPMPTLYVENVPGELYEALRARARASRKSIAAAVIELLQQNVPTAAELARRKQFLRLVTKIGRQQRARPGPLPSTEEMLREDRER